MSGGICTWRGLSAGFRHLGQHLAFLSCVTLRWRDEKLLPALLRFVQVGEFDGWPSFPTTSTGLNPIL
jgi:hypothetical protein